jgi:predicted transport protein
MEWYLDWLMDHKAEFELLVLDKLGKDAKNEIEWSTPRLLCIAGDFTRYDEHAVQQINRNIELIRYKKFGDKLLLLELVNAVSAKESVESKPTSGGSARQRTVTECLEQASPDLRDRYEALSAFMIALGDDVQQKALKLYFAYKRIKNFACVDVHTQTKNIMVYLKVDPKSIDVEEGFTRDVSKIGHFGTGSLEVTIRSDNDLERAKHLIEKSYEIS